MNREELSDSLSIIDTVVYMALQFSTWQKPRNKNLNSGGGSQILSQRHQQPIHPEQQCAFPNIRESGIHGNVSLHGRRALAS